MNKGEYGYLSVKVMGEPAQGYYLDSIGEVNKRKASVYENGELIETSNYIIEIVKRGKSRNAARSRVYDLKNNLKEISRHKLPDYIRTFLYK